MDQIVRDGPSASQLREEILIDKREEELHTYTPIHTLSSYIHTCLTWCMYVCMCSLYHEFNEERKQREMARRQSILEDAARKGAGMCVCMHVYVIMCMYVCMYVYL